MIQKYKGSSTRKKNLLHIATVLKEGTMFFMDTKGRLFWSDKDFKVIPIRSLPHHLQIPFFIKFIQNHELSERIKDIEDPIVCIEMYIKAQFMAHGFSQVIR